MMETPIGKILFVDDKYEVSIKEAIVTLIENGLSVQYWNGKEKLPNTIQNVRVVVLDLDLAELKDRGLPEYYLSAAQALLQIPGPYFVIILSLDFQEYDPHELQAYYEKTFRQPIRGFISERGLTKAAVHEDPTRLTGIITSFMTENSLLKLVQSWEMAVSGAKDRALSDLITKEVENALNILIYSLKKDFGKDGASRELTGILLRLISRQITEADSPEVLKQIIEEIDFTIPENYPSNSDKLLFNRIMFYDPQPSEYIFTGDIYKLPDQTPRPDQYAIVLTPMCDLVQGKTKMIQVCMAFPILEKYFENPDYPPFHIDNAVILRSENGLKGDAMTAYLKKRYYSGNSLPDNLCSLWNFKNEEDIFGLCFDFHNVQSIEEEEIRKWERISRLDSPFLGEMIQKYNSLMSRVGTININDGPNKLTEYVSKLKN